ncbi:MAG: RNA polymerase sigma-70 factor [Porphyromonadaceae bacterium]|nr:MAG: RNA polymerase sigma-70 factor [Porphyromonadaceae bacterium]
MNYTEDLFLLQKLKEGDIHALEVIFKMHYSNLNRYLLFLFKNELLVEHIAQDIFVYLWESRETLEIKTSLESYLYAAGRYKALNQIRNNQLHETIKQKMTASMQDSQSIDTEFEMRELEGIINEAISSLPPRCQQIFRLSRDEEMTYQDIAKFLNISINTVEGQMSIALKRLRSALKPYYFKLFFAA